jgi:P27 family predicted phage terminase small subunit
MPPKPPRELSRESRALWRVVVAEYNLESHHLALLRLALEALDRASKAQAILEREGLMLLDRFDQPKAHPMVAVRRDAEISTARLWRELQLDAEAAPDIRIPRPRSA